MLLVEDTTKSNLPNLPFAKVCELCLPPDYELSLVFVDNKKSHELNLAYRQKDKPTNILSFPLDHLNGEIFIDLEYTKTEAKKLGREFDEYLLFLFIHGVLHLKGMTHGSKMESEEQKLLNLLWPKNHSSA